MKKLLTLLGLTLSLSFTACTSKSVAAETDMQAEPKGQNISAYLTGAFVDTATATANLEKEGFTVLATYKSTKKNETIVFTCKGLQMAADKPTRGFAAVMRMLIDNEHQAISITNPIYFGKAFLQDDYNHKIASKVYAKINKAFMGLKPNADVYAYDDLDGYHFMMGMPYYEDAAVIGEGSNEELVAKAHKYKDGKNLIFELKISDKATLIGYALGKKTSKFPKKIGTDKAQLLPYTVLIEDGEAKMLAPKFYLAVSYPLLSMGEFMTIATVPGAIEKDLKKPFK